MYFFLLFCFHFLSSPTISPVVVVVDVVFVFVILVNVMMMIVDVLVVVVEVVVVVGVVVMVGGQVGDVIVLMIVAFSVVGKVSGGG